MDKETKERRPKYLSGKRSPMRVEVHTINFETHETGRWVDVGGKRVWIKDEVQPQWRTAEDD
jgi:hypothetical protein